MTELPYYNTKNQDQDQDPTSITQKHKHKDKNPTLLWLSIDSLWVTTKEVHLRTFIINN